MDYYCDRILTTFEPSRGGFGPSELHQLTIKFDFFFKTEYLEFIPNQEDHTTLDLIESFLIWTDDISATVAVGDSLSLEDVAAAVGDAVGHLLHDDDRETLIRHACNEVRGEFPAAETLVPPKHKILNIRFDVAIQHVHIYAAESGMVPAAEASLALLEECEVGRGERCCCICLDEIRRGGGGGGALRMPCLHVFHSGCIKEWLRSSHYCPLCRYPMPTRM